jgi:hemolysin-activating ACP:hemolysin acyltransferase
VRDRHAALGHVVTYMMGKPGFARLQFGAWSRILVGQINRDQYLFATRAGRVVGFFGWAFAPEAAAEAWRGGAPLDAAVTEGPAGDCLIINAWSADDSAVHRLLVGQMRRLARGRRAIYGLRSYPDGRVRILRVGVNAAALDAHLARGGAA